MTVNKVILVGRLGRDPEARSTKSGSAVANLNIATDEGYDDSSGQRQERTEWHRVVTFGKTAELCSRYLRKGRLVYVEGRLQTREWQDKEGQKRFSTEIVAQRVQFLDKGADGGGAPRGAGDAGGGGYDYPPPGNEPRGGGGGGGAGRGPGGGGPGFEDDDVPF